MSTGGSNPQRSAHPLSTSNQPRCRLRPKNLNRTAPDSRSTGSSVKLLDWKLVVNHEVFKSAKVRYVLTATERRSSRDLGRR
ncbi:hypothetical protein PGT21_000069 [Puccinia graminis f. sp. tritici]|uniref:Uncharacterized protein n=1 Tax=Puccinia graminis f. sp. tritici TaxID=56615 RepID=A0A5B0NIH7_PUCGR|nr:hypothetical protein PGT21_000069 [Puccinia graminis f. sp. tritici]